MKSICENDMNLFAVKSTVDDHVVRNMVRLMSLQVEQSFRWHQNKTSGNEEGKKRGLNYIYDILCDLLQRF